MRVKCTCNDLAEINDVEVRVRLGNSIHIEGPIRDLKVGKEYLVQAVEKRDDGLWFYLHSFKDSHHPYPYPAEMFEMQEQLVPQGWCLGIKKVEGSMVVKWMSFPEWAMDDQFFEKLVDGDAKAMSIYRTKRRMLCGVD